MEVFISWSGEKSKIVARALRNWIPYVLHNVQAWMSEKDIDAGARWDKELEKHLENSKFAIVCLTMKNQNAPWILFESGAITRILDDSFICPYLIDLSPTDLVSAPLSQFQSKQANKEQTWELICSLNKCLNDRSLPEDRLKLIYEKFWPDLENDLKKSIDDVDRDKEKRSVKSINSEILEIVRDLSRSSDRNNQFSNLKSDIKYLKEITKDIFQELYKIASGKFEPGLGSRFIEVLIEFSTNGDMEKRILTVNSRATLGEILDQVWGILNANSSLTPGPYTYLFDWILIRKRDNCPLILKGVQNDIRAIELFKDNEVWSALKLDKPVILEPERFGFKKGGNDHYLAKT
jgi:hypothetical protein